MTKEQFIKEAAKYVQEFAPKYNIKVCSAPLAQIILESACGTSELAVNAHNYSGLKYRAGRCPSSNGIYYKDGAEQDPVTGQYTNSAMQWFKFPDMRSGIQGYFDFTNISNYKSLKGVTDPKTYLENIKAAGYATSIKYVENCMNVIRQYNLTQYDNTVEVETTVQKASYTLKTNLADKSNYGSSRSTSSIKYIVWHYTANDGDTDEANGKYFNSPNRNASAHYFVDDDSVTQSVPDNYVAWSVGGNRYSNYKTTGGAKLYGIANNANTLNIELCDTQKNGKYNVSDKTLANAIALTKDLMKKYNISIENVIRHFDVTGKSCPAYYVDETAWNNVKNKIQKTSTSSSTTTTSTTTNLYRVRKSWADSASQKGAYASLDNAKKNCPSGYSVFDKDGKCVYSNVPVVDNKKYYRVQTGSYAIEKNAIALQEKLKKDGFNSIIKKEGLLHKVQVGAYSQKSNAEAMLKNLKAKGYSAFIVYA